MSNYFYTEFCTEKTSETFFIIHELVKRKYKANMMQNFILWQKQQQIVLLHQESWSVVMPKITKNQL